MSDYSLDSCAAPLVELTRGVLVESVHVGSLAVADPDGKLLAWAGDPERVVYLRSSAKPFQALPFVESGAVEAFGLEDGDIAIACASHTGTDAHVEAVRALQRKAGLREADLLCGTHPPADRPTWRDMVLRGEEPTPLRHNCSGKHSGMLAAARQMLGGAADGGGRAYIDPEHPIQRKILEAFAEMCGMAPGEVVVGIDGCSAPNFAVPLRAAAMAAARMMDPRGRTEARAQACRRIVRAMTARPELVRGEGNFDTELMRAGAGGILSKGGAEGYQLIGIAPGMLGKSSPACGLALKILDGDGAGRAAELAALETLTQLGMAALAQNPALAKFRPHRLTNWRGLAVGEIRASFSLLRG